MTRKLRRRRTSRPPLRRNAVQGPGPRGEIDPEGLVTCPHCERKARMQPSRWQTNYPGVTKYDCELCDETFFVADPEPVSRNAPAASPDDQYLGMLGAVMANTEREVHPNRSARAIGQRASMRTEHFGKDLDDERIDAVTGAEAKHLDAAMDRYKTFHAKDPIRVAELSHDLAEQWVPIGDARAVMYRTDKWKKDGTDEDYKHLHDKREGKEYEHLKGVRLYEPAAQVKKSTVQGRRDSAPLPKSQQLPVAEPRALTLLGYCLGLFVERDDDGEVYEVNPRGCYLFCSPSGDMLALYSPDKQPDGSSGFLAVMAGGNLRVLKDGIDG